MAPSEVKLPSTRSRIATGSALGLTLCAPLVLTWWWGLPRPDPTPPELPPLVLDAHEVERQLQRDERDRQLLPTGEPLARRRRLYDETSVAEHELNEPPGRARARANRLRAALEAVLAAHGREALRPIRADDLARMEAALRGGLSSGERVAALGGFTRVLAQYGLVHDGVQVAPDFVVRTLFKARWNAMHHRPLTLGFSRVELQAYWGWLALRSPNAPLQQRYQALEHYETARGPHAGLARIALGWEDERPESLHAQLSELSFAFRHRNHLLFLESRHPEERSVPAGP